MRQRLTMFARVFRVHSFTFRHQSRCRTQSSANLPVKSNQGESAPLDVISHIFQIRQNQFHMSRAHTAEGNGKHSQFPEAAITKVESTGLHGADFGGLCRYATRPAIITVVVCGG